MLPVAAPSAAALVAGARTTATALFAETNDSVEDVDTELDVSSRDWRAFRISDTVRCDTAAYVTQLRPLAVMLAHQYMPSLILQLISVQPIADATILSTCSQLFA
eukprot:15064-Heterococcus_DN1.PRE.3